MHSSTSHTCANQLSLINHYYTTLAKHIHFHSSMSHTCVNQLAPTTHIYITITKHVSHLCQPTFSNYSLLHRSGRTYTFRFFHVNTCVNQLSLTIHYYITVAEHILFHPSMSHTYVNRCPKLPSSMLMSPPAFSFLDCVFREPCRTASWPPRVPS